MGSYRKWLEHKIGEGKNYMPKDLHGLLYVSGVHSREEWYAKLATVNANIVQFRDIVSRQKQIIAKTKDDKMLEVFVEILGVSQEILRLLEERRRVLMASLRRFPLPPPTQEEIDSMNIGDDNAKVRVSRSGPGVWCMQ